MTNKKVEIPVGGTSISLQTGFVAKQSDSSVWARMGDTIVLATVVGNKEAKEDAGFFPLNCDYREHISAAGKIPGGFFKREGRPNEREILVSRIIDRSIRPLFPENFLNEVQVIVNVLSADLESNPDILSVNAAALALHSSSIPFKGPMACARVGFIDNNYVINPTFAQMEKSSVNLIISATAESIVMVEGEGKEISEEQFIEAVEFGRGEIKKILDAMNDFSAEKMEVVQPLYDESVMVSAEKLISGKIMDAYSYPEKKAREEFYKSLEESFLASFEDEEKKKEAKEIFNMLLKNSIRKAILETGKRLDGRTPTEVRPIECSVGLLPRTHGSALFTRGQTQCLASVTLGTSDDEQIIDGLHAESTKKFMLHYNFPPFSVGEVAFLRGTSRREIGHGALAERSLSGFIPDEIKFPYTIRIVANILESNGSSSMATVCASSLALMDAGVPFNKHVAGVSLGIIKEGDKYILLTDIAGEEDHYGNLDLKLAGTEKGITGFQMDVKGSGLTTAIMKEALLQANGAKMGILKKMSETIAATRPEISIYAPRMLSLKIKTDKIGLVIGPGGKMIKKIIEDTGADINIDDDGTVKIFSIDCKACEAAADIIKGLTEEPETGRIYEGTVVKIMEFGAFVQFLPGKDGLVHISELAPHRVKKVEDIVKVGDKIKVKFIGMDDKGKVKLSRKQALTS
ncbi:MAG TPA: polyribonucleotide nucleotidyltransferase [bacterium]|nr:polyribonucleotide nucleotidyltransferase [bacterium]